VEKKKNMGEASPRGKITALSNEIVTTTRFHMILSRIGKFGGGGGGVGEAHPPGKETGTSAYYVILKNF